MARIGWLIEGVSFGNSNCEYAHPCQLEGLPTDGSCRGFELSEIDNSRFGSVNSAVISPIKFELEDSYGQFNRLRQHGGGVIRP